jgi:hypothetical protein
MAKIKVANPVVELDGDENIATSAWRAATPSHQCDKTGHNRQ